MRKKLLLMMLIVLGAAMPGAAQAHEADPFPAGACVRATFVDSRPVCVIVDPTG